MSVRPSSQQRRPPRGASLVEAAVSLVVFSIGLTGVLQLQLLGVRSNHMARELGLATSLARDLVENIALWEYDDPRLVPLESVTATTDPRVAARAELGRAAAVTDAGSRPHYGEPSTALFPTSPPNFPEAAANALNNDRLRDATSPGYDGAGCDVDGDGLGDFQRYWSVFRLDADADGIEDGKLVVVVVRWFEGGLGFRQIVQSTFKANAGAFNL